MENRETTTKEQAVRDLVPRVYGEGARIEVERGGTGGLIRVLDPAGSRVAGWFWDVTSTSQNTEEQAWHALLGMVQDDERERSGG
jgi:hypothetical protein